LLVSVRLSLCGACVVRPGSSFVAFAAETLVIRAARLPADARAPLCATSG